MKQEAHSRWLISDMYYPSESVDGPIKSHEAICILNTGDVPAKLKITLYFEDRDPVSLQTLSCGAKRTAHIRMDLVKTSDGTAVPSDTPYAAMVESDVTVSVQYSRADARQKALAIMTTTAFPLN